MNSVLRKFVQRAPRYVLRPNDRHIVRYAPEHAIGPTAVHKTKLINLSESGCAIIMDAIASPRVGERLKIELPVLNGEQIAWWATIVRVQLQEANWWSPSDDNDEKVLVALRFDELPDGHRKLIQSGLEERFLEELRERRRLQRIYLKSLVAENIWKITAYAIGTIITFAVLYALSRPTYNYDPARGTPWGQRFQFFDFEKQNK